MLAITKYFFLLLFCFSFLHSQNISFNLSDWRNYTDIKSINSITTIEDYIWVGTNGGAFSYNKATKVVQNFTNVEGLSSIEITAITADSKKRIWFGNSNGWIDIFDLDSKSWQHISDIYFAINYLKKGIFAFLPFGDSIYIATDFGLSVYDTKIKDFKDTYLKFGKFTSSASVKDIEIFSNKIWVATQDGLACASLSSKNLLSPTEWENYDNTNGLISKNISSIEVFDNSLFIATDNGLMKIKDDILSSINFPNVNIVKLCCYSEFLYISTSYSVYKYELSGQYSKISDDLKFQISTIKIDNTGTIWVGFVNKGISYLYGSGWEYLNMNCPNSNIFRSMVVDETGALWVATGRDERGRGFYSLKDGIWTNYNKETFPILRTNDYYCVTVGPDNSKWIGSWGRGLALIKNDGSIKIFDETNSKLSGISNDSKWVTISGLTTDGKGNVWILNYAALSGNGLVSFSSDSSWNAYMNGINPNITIYTDIVVDDIGTKFIISDDPLLRGLFYFNEKYKIGTSNSTGIVNLDEILPGLSNPVLNCLAIDRTGSLWVGTDHGVSEIINTREPSSKILRPCFTTRCNISGQYINCIEVDALNNKWIGTQTSGVWVLNSDGSSTLAQYNIQNSDILDNNVKSIAIDHKTGTVYIGTEKGLSSFKTVLIEPLPEFSNKLKISPNPFYPQEGNVLIDGLVEASLIKIITSSGKLIKNIIAPGGRIATWDGTDNSGEYVSSGVYFIVAYSSDGNQATVGKIAVIRK